MKIIHRIGFFFVLKAEEPLNAIKLKVKNTTSFPSSSVPPLLVSANIPPSAFAFSFSLLESFLLEYWASLLLANLDLLFSVNSKKTFLKRSGPLQQTKFTKCNLFSYLLSVCTYASITMHVWRSEDTV